MLIYDKAEQENVSNAEIEELLKEINIPLWKKCKVNCYSTTASNRLIFYAFFFSTFLMYLFDLRSPNTKKTGVSTGQVVGFWLNVLTISNLFFKDNDLEKTIQEISSQNSF
ncbi:hypothetical protein LEP1GSC038_0680 [Leptospira weilii str. 2006001855]|uniref:Uncharacterized protein n=1 Tax=Leptospira weilii str. 2006001855 TaxID=996804 RepID=M6FSM7_9LEPT|nr:hypothetical protein LEP1GSC038_0680 [Leptospira weilii str. 2006001855]